MTGTELERYVALFPGANADEVLDVAADVATKFGDVVKRQRMFKRIGESDHIQIEAWQTIGALTGVLAPEGEVEPLAWPATLGALPDEPPLPGREPRNRDSDEWRVWKRAERIRSAWERHDELLRARAMGKTYGFVSRFRSTKAGAGVGWGEGSVDRNEANWTGKDDHELRSMAQTRAQSRALGAPLKFVVKLAGYETTPAEELDGTASSTPNGAAASSPAAPWGPLADAKQENEAAAAVKLILEAAGALDQPDTPAQFVLRLGQLYSGVPEVSVVTLRGLAKAVAQLRAAAAPPPPRDASTENQPPPPAQSAYHQQPPPPGPDPNVVYPQQPPGRYQGD